MSILICYECPCAVHVDGFGMSKDWLLSVMHSLCPSFPLTAVCQDIHGNCENWARTGECERNPAWMLPNCPKSCNQCKFVFLAVLLGRLETLISEI